jgi:hypothetical protein
MSSDSENKGPPSAPNTARQIPTWQRTAIRQLTWGGFAAAIAGTTVSVLFERLTNTKGSSIVFIPWLIVFIIMVPAAYRRGVRDARAHPEDE